MRMDFEDLGGFDDLDSIFLDPEGSPEQHEVLTKKRKCPYNSACTYIEINKNECPSYFDSMIICKYDKV